MRWVVGGGGAREGAVGRRQRPVERAGEGAGEGAVGRPRRWSGGGCGGSSAAVERGRVRGVLGGEGDSDRDGGVSR